MTTDHTDENQTSTRANEVKLILSRLIAQVEAAEVEAADTSWQHEKDDLLNKALNSVQWRLSNLAYDLSHSGKTLLNKRETE